MAVHSQVGLFTVRRLYDGGALVAEYDQTGTMLRRFVHGPNPGADTPLVWYEGPTMQQSAARMLSTDLQGSVTSVTDFGGNPIAINRYDEYGRPQSGNLGRFQYTGQAWLPEIGMYYYKARMYSPTLGRFMQTDPIGYADGVNWYNYVGGDPVNFVDPSGTNEICINIYGSVYDPVENVINTGVKIGQECYSYNSDSLIRDWASGAALRGEISTLQDPPCNRMQQQLQQAGGAGVKLGGAIVAGGAVVTGGSTVLAGGGAITGNVPATGVGIMGIALGAKITATGAVFQAGSALVAFSGGTSSRQLVKDGSDAIVNRLPLPGPIRTGVNKAIDRASEYVPDFRICG